MQKNTQAIIAITALITVSIILTATTFAAIGVNKNLSSSGIVAVTPNLGVYSNSACTVPASTINWGSLSPGGTTNQTIYVKNTGNGTSLYLSMITSNWSPEGVDQSINITWDRENTRLMPGKAIAATLTLTVSPSIVDISDFGVEITISGTK